MDLAYFSNYIAQTMRTFAHSIYDGIVVNIGGVAMSLTNIIIAGLIVVGITAVIGVAINRS